LGNESPFGWCDFVTSTEQAPLRGILRSFWASRPVNARARCYEVTCLRIGAPKTQRAWDGLQRSLGRGREPGFVHSYRPTLPRSRRRRSDWPRADISVRCSCPFFVGEAEILICVGNVRLCDPKRISRAQVFPACPTCGAARRTAARAINPSGFITTAETDRR
jgi:hypothetical protein